MGYKSLEVRRERGRQYYYAHRKEILEKQKEYDKHRRDKTQRRKVARDYYYRHKEEVVAKRKARTLAKQKFGPCEICTKDCRLVYDHDHSTNAFRGWICTQCNIALGMVKDNKEILCRMIKYLQERTTA